MDTTPAKPNKAYARHPITGKQIRGFACMDPEKRRAISSKGGKVAQAGGYANRWTPEQAKEAGRRGGHAAHVKFRQRQAAQ
jgi:general stress protein YciG